MFSKSRNTAIVVLESWALIESRAQVYYRPGHCAPGIVRVVSAVRQIVLWRGCIVAFPVGYSESEKKGDAHDIGTECFFAAEPSTSAGAGRGTRSEEHTSE